MLPVSRLLSRLLCQLRTDLPDRELSIRILNQNMRNPDKDLHEMQHARLLVPAGRKINRKHESLFAVEDLHIQDRLGSRLVLPDIHHLDIQIVKPVHIADVLLIQKVCRLLCRHLVMQFYIWIYTVLDAEAHLLVDVLIHILYGERIPEADSYRQIPEQKADRLHQLHILPPVIDPGEPDVWSIVIKTGSQRSYGDKEFISCDPVFLFYNRHFFLFNAKIGRKFTRLIVS